VPPRQLQPNTPRDIETICLKCLDKSPTRRYGTALELAADLRCFINGESISARPAGWVERASRRMRRNPAVTGLIALIVVLLLGGQAAILNEAHRANQSEQAALADSRRADLERAKADSERQKADRERARALAAAREADRSRREAEAARQQAEATRREAVKHQQDAERERARAIESQVLTEVALERTLDALNSAAILGGTITSIPGLEPLGRGMLDKTLALYEELLADDGLNAARDGAGSASSNSGSSEHSSEHSRRLVALLYAGEIHLRLKHTLRAEQLLTEAATLSEQEPDSNRSFDQFHRNVRIWWNLATIHSRRDNWDAALTCLQKALSITDAALQKEPTSDLHQTSRMNILTKFAEALQHQGRSPEAIEVSNESIAIGRKLIEQNPQNFPAHSDLAAALHRSSVVLRTLNRTAEADANAAEALALRQQMYDLFPHVARAALDLTQSWLDQSRLDLEAGQLESATALARRAEELLAPLFRLSSGNEDLQDRLLDLKFVRLRATIQLGSSPGIDASLSDLSPLLAAARRNLPTNVKFRELASHWLQVQGNLLVARGDEAQARDCFEAAIEARFGIMGATPQDRPAQVAASYGHLARLLASCPLAALRRPEQAMRLADLAVETAPDDASIQLIRGIVLMEAGQHEAAGRAFERCSQLTLPSESDGSDGSENSDSSEKSLKRLRMDRRILQTVNLLRMGERAAAIEYSRQLEFPELEYTPESTDMLQYIEEVRRLPESEEAGLPADARLR
jgi:tetratricopeptide (TPR) repeat protein